MKSLALRLALGAALLIPPVAGAQEWARFRGPGGGGLGVAKGVPAQITDADIKWAVDLPGSGHSSPVLWGDTVFLTATGGDQRAVLALSAADGALRWRSEHGFDRYRQHKYNDFSSSTPCVDARRVYVTWTSPAGVEALAIDHAGEQVWKRRIGGFSAVHGSSASPVLAGGVLVIGSHGEGDESFIIGLEAETGAEKWRLARDSNEKGAYSTPVERVAGDGVTELVFSSTAHGLTAIDPRDGTLRWQHKAGFSQRCVGSPVVSGDTVFASAGSGGGGKESAVVRVADGKARGAWEAGRKGLPYVPSGIAWKGLIYLLNDGGIMTCLRAGDGELLWQERVVGAPYASPIIVGGRIYCCSKEGEMAVVEAGEKLAPLGSYKFPDGIYATPAVAGGRMYVRTFSKLYCIGR